MTTIEEKYKAAHEAMCAYMLMIRERNEDIKRLQSKLSEAEAKLKTAEIAEKNQLEQCQAFRESSRELQARLAEADKVVGAAMDYEMFWRESLSGGARGKILINMVDDYRAALAKSRASGVEVEQNGI